MATDHQLFVGNQIFAPIIASLSTCTCSCQRAPLNADDEFDVTAVDLHLEILDDFDQKPVPLFVLRNLVPRSASCFSVGM